MQFVFWSSMLVGQSLLSDDLYEQEEHGEIRASVSIRPHARVFVDLVNPPRAKIVDSEGTILADNKVIRFPSVRFKVAPQEDFGNDKELLKEYFLKEAWPLFVKNVEILESSMFLGRKLLEESEKTPERFWSYYLGRRWKPYIFPTLLSDAEVNELSKHNEYFVYAFFTRSYPEKSFFCHAVGWMKKYRDLQRSSIKNGKLRNILQSSENSVYEYRGSQGLETHLDTRDDLKAKRGVVRRIYNEKSLMTYENYDRRYSLPEKNLELSLNPSMQRAGEEFFKNQKKLEGSFLFLDAEKSKLLTYLSWPQFDLNITSPFLRNKDLEQYLSAQLDRNAQRLYYSEALSDKYRSLEHELGIEYAEPFFKIKKSVGFDFDNKDSSKDDKHLYMTPLQILRFVIQTEGLASEYGEITLLNNHLQKEKVTKIERLGFDSVDSSFWSRIVNIEWERFSYTADLARLPAKFYDPRIKRESVATIYVLKNRVQSKEIFSVLVVESDGSTVSDQDLKQVFQLR